MLSASVAPIDGNSTRLPVCATAIITGTQTNAFTSVPKKLISTSTPCRRVVVTAYFSNADCIAIGDTNAVAEPLMGGSKVGQGEQITQGGTITIDVIDACLVYLAVATAGDGVSYSVYV